MSHADAPATTLLLCRDLMFVSKVMATARAMGLTVQVVRDPAQLPRQGARLIVDLNQEGAIEAAAAWKDTTVGRVVGFVSHVDTDAINRAHAAGLDQVLPRSRFTATLEQILGS
jgi:electron transfer flavoprotein alpha/beta subunit